MAELEPIEDVFRAVAEGLPFERTDGAPSGGFGAPSRAVAWAIARIIRGYRDDGEPLLEAFEQLSDTLDAAIAETTFNRLEDLWQMEL
jgi:hypothetical protein